MSEADPGFRMSVRATAEATELVMAGTISERTIFEVPQPPGRLIRIDTSGVNRINSLGVSAWIRYMAKLSDLGIPIAIRPLSVALTSQASMIANFLGSAHVETFQAPYYCPECEHSQEPVFELSAQVPDNIACPNCKAAMEFDDEKESFLSFRER